MVAAKRGAKTTGDGSGIVFALEHMFHGRWYMKTSQCEANSLWAS